MQAVSAAYNPYTDERFVGIDLVFRFVDLDAADQATPESNGVEDISVLTKLLSGMARSPGKVMTMEDNLVRLDGSWSILPDGQTVPYWSTALSGSTGTFLVPPMLTMSLSAPASSVGFSMTFDEPAGCWPSRLRITASAGGSQLARQEFSVDGPNFEADMPVDGYDQVVVEFLETPVPYRRIKLYAFVFGIVQRFDPATVVSATFTFGASLDCSSIPSRQLTVTFDNLDRKYNFLNPTGVYKFLQDGQEIQAGLSINGELVDMGQHYFTSAEATDEAITATITANDRILQLENETYEAGMDGIWSFSEALAALLGADAVLDLPADLAGREVGRQIPNGTTKREALRLLSQAAMCSCWMSRSGVFVFRDLVSGMPDSVDTLDENNLYSRAGIAVTPYYDKIVLTVNNDFAVVGPSSFEYTAGTGTHVKTYANPCASEGQAVADWLLEANRRRLKYTPKNRGNPAVEVGDTLTIYNAYDEAADAVLLGQTLTYDGGLTAQTEAVGA